MILKPISFQVKNTPIVLEITWVLLKSYGKPFLLVQMSGGIIGKTRYFFGCFMNLICLCVLYFLLWCGLCFSNLASGRVRFEFRLILRLNLPIRMVFVFQDSWVGCLHLFWLFVYSCMEL